MGFGFPNARSVVEVVEVVGVVGIGFPAAREVASATTSSARKNNTTDNVIMFERMEMM